MVKTAESEPALELLLLGCYIKKQTVQAIVMLSLHLNLQPSNTRG